jgi:hypothetical protein
MVTASTKLMRLGVIIGASFLLEEAFGKSPW